MSEETESKGLIGIEHVYDVNVITSISSKNGDILGINNSLFFLVEVNFIINITWLTNGNEIIL